MPKYVDGTLFIKGLPFLLNMNNYQSLVVQEDISHLEINAAPLQTRFQFQEEKNVDINFWTFNLTCQLLDYCQLSLHQVHLLQVRQP